MDRRMDGQSTYRESEIRGGRGLGAFGEVVDPKVEKLKIENYL